MDFRRTVRSVGFAFVLGSALGGCTDELVIEETPVIDVDMFASVDPFIGTGGLGFGQGSAYPGPAVPFGMIHAGPDTRNGAGAPGISHCAGYWYDDDRIQAFSLARMHGTGLPDYGVIGFMPHDGVGDPTSRASYAARFSHDNEDASPGYYRVVLDSGIEVAITTTRRAALFRFRFPDDIEPTVLLDLDHSLGDGETLDASVAINAVTGALTSTVRFENDLSARFGGLRLHAAAAFDVSPVAVGVWDADGLRPGDTSAAGPGSGAWLSFSPGTTEVFMRVGLSYVDTDGAAGNLAAELPDFDFARVRAQAEADWRQALSQVSLSGATERDGKILATALYHTLLMPTLRSDVDGRYFAADESIARADTERYGDFSLWDTYRTFHPWLLLLEHDVNAALVASMYSFAQRKGAYWRWGLAHGDARSMVGTPADMVLAESALKGVSFVDENQAFDYALVTATQPAPEGTAGRKAIEDYIEFGYVPADLHSGSVANTLEYAIADHALSLWADRLGRTQDAALLRTRAGHWRNTFDPSVGFPRARLADGTWDTWPGASADDGAYVEGTAWQYLWLVPHDFAGLTEMLGGRDAMLETARDFFARSEIERPILGLRFYYWHGNEPDIIAPWIFASLGEPEEAAHWIDWIFRDHYGVGPDGLPGNDDGGTLSAWALFAAGGIYPIAGTDRYIVGVPRQARMVITRGSGTLTIEAEPNPVDYKRVERVTLDGEVLTDTELRHAQLVGDHILRFEMTQAP